MRIVVRVVLSLLPLAMTPVLGYLLAQGHINLGGGEKDIILVVPWLVWSLLFAVSSGIFWRRGHSMTSSAWRSALVGLAGLGLIGVALAILGHLGVASLF
jgi:hypothetical protein